MRWPRSNALHRRKPRKRSGGPASVLSTASSRTGSRPISMSNSCWPASTCRCVASWKARRKSPSACCATPCFSWQKARPWMGALPKSGRRLASIATCPAVACSIPRRWHACARSWMPCRQVSRRHAIAGTPMWKATPASCRSSRHTSNACCRRPRRWKPASWNPCWTNWPPPLPHGPCARAGVPALAQQAQGALTMLELPDAAGLLGAATATVQAFVEEGYPDEATQQRLADAFSSLGLYIESYCAGRADAARILRPVLIEFGVIDPDSADDSAFDDTVESGLPARKTEVQENYLEWRDQPDDATKKKFLDALTELSRDAELNDDATLKQQTRAALDVCCVVL